MKITEAELIEAIRVLAARDPDLVYQFDQGTCTYLPNPSSNPELPCIVGGALLDLGVPETVLAELDQGMLQSDGVKNVDARWGEDAVVDALQDYLDPAALYSEWVVQAQLGQDMSMSRSDAVRAADAVHG